MTIRSLAFPALVFLFLLSGQMYGAEKADLKYVNADIDSYIGKVITVKGEVYKPNFSPDTDRVDIQFADAPNVTVIVEKGTPLYKKVVDLDLDYSSVLKVTGELHRFNNSARAYIIPVELSKGATLVTWFFRICIGFSVLMVVLTILSRFSNQGATTSEQTAQNDNASKNSDT